MNIFKKLPLYNISRKKGSSLGIFTLILCLSFSLCLAAYIGLSMKNGMDSTKDRLGADVIIMPVDAQTKIEGAILNGEPNSFYFNSDLTEKVKEIQGVKEVSPQVYTATLSAGCCAFPVQIIGIDFETDFSVKPWMEGKLEELKKDEIIAGANITADKDSTLIFYEHEFYVKERLDATGMGFDNCIFMSIEDARNLAKKATEYGVSIPEGQENLISNIMVNVEDDQRADLLLYDINKEIKGEGKATKSTAIVDSIGKQMESSSNYILILLSIVWALCLTVLFIVFPMITKSRSRELATLRVLGATKVQISTLLLKEMGILSFFGSITGTLLGFIIASLFSKTIKVLLDVPFLSPELPVLIIIAILSVLICTLVGPLSSLITINKLNKKEIAITYGENR